MDGRMDGLIDWLKECWVCDLNSDESEANVTRRIFISLFFKHEKQRRPKRREILGILCKRRTQGEERKKRRKDVMMFGLGNDKA